MVSSFEHCAYKLQMLAAINIYIQFIMIYIAPGIETFFVFNRFIVFQQATWVVCAKPTQIIAFSQLKKQICTNKKR